MANDHYVPQCLLRAFGTKRKKQTKVWVFDKWERKSFHTNIYNILAENKFNEVKLENGKTTSIEAHLSELESMAAPILNKIRKEKSLNTLDAGERYVLLIFVAAQMLRTKKSRNDLKRINDMIVEKFIPMGTDPNHIEGFIAFKDENDIKGASIFGMLDTIKKFAELLSEKVYFLISAPKGKEFYISDHPVVMSNQNDFWPRSNIGLKVKGIEVYFPIAHNLAITFQCESVANNLYAELEPVKNTAKQLRAKMMISSNHAAEPMRHILAKYEEAEKRGDDAIRAMQNGGCLEAEPDNILHCNDLQVRWSSRYIVAKTEDFGLVEEILKEYPDLQYGIQLEDAAASSP